MFDDILKRDDVVALLKQVATNNRYNKKNDLDSVNYFFVDFEQALFTVVDALYKYKVIIDDDNLLDSYVEQLELLIKKIDNFEDINKGINKLIAKFSALKLGYKEVNDKNKVQILEYIYDKYINNGYLFHAICDVYKDDIKINGFIPQQYNNLYDEFSELEDIVGYKVLDTDFNTNKVSFTDSFMMAYYYAMNSPVYFYNLICNNDLIKKLDDKKSYLKNDYQSCLGNLNKIIYKLDLNEKKAKKVKDIFNLEWSLINRSNYCPTVMVVKRSLFMKDSNFNISELDTDISEAVDMIIGGKYNDIKCDFSINSSDIEFISLPRYDDLIDKKVDVDVDEDFIEYDNSNDEYGKISILLLIGALLVALGVIITVVMIMSGG